MYLSDIHTHSIASGHGTTCTISDMAKAASRKGLKLLGITDHGPGTLAAGTSSYFRSLTYAPKKRFGIELQEIYQDALNRLFRQKLLAEDKNHDRIYLTDLGIDISNTVLAEFLL